MSYYCPHCRVRFYSGDERCECRATLVLEGGAPTGDHHAADRGRPVRTPHEIWEHINADHPCCIGVGDAVSLLKENEGLRAIITRWQRRDLKKATMPSEVREDGAKEVERLRAELDAANKECEIRSGYLARIEATLAIIMGTRAVGNPHLEAVLSDIVKALKSEGK